MRLGGGFRVGREKGGWAVSFLLDNQLAETDGGAFAESINRTQLQGADLRQAGRFYIVKELP